MDLPFAVDTGTIPRSPTAASERIKAITADDSSLVTASSQGSLIPAQDDFTPENSSVDNGGAFALTPPPPPPASNAPHHPSSHAIHNSTESISTTTVDALKSAGNKVSSVFSHLASYPKKDSKQQQQINDNNNDDKNNLHNNNIHKKLNDVEETIDFAYINVTDEDEVDIWLDDDAKVQYANMLLMENDKDYQDEQHSSSNSNNNNRADILTVLIQGRLQQNDESNSDNEVSEQLLKFTEQANDASQKALKAKKDGNLQQALDGHTEAAKAFHEAALLVRQTDPSTANALLLLSQTQAKSAVALQRIVKLRPNILSAFQNNRLRATVRGALSSKSEADISDSTFLGKATKPAASEDPTIKSSSTHSDESQKLTNSSTSSTSKEKSQNPVDEMMELERELRDMDMALELGNSIASLDARTQNRMKTSVMESFMVVPPGSSYMSNTSSVILGPAGRSNNNPVPLGSAGVRARANRVQSNITRPVHPTVQAAKPPQTLESSWWGNTSTAATSQVLSSSVISLASSGPNQAPQPANTKQLMRLMDSLRTLGDENATLLREVEDAEAARAEAKAARQQMKRFKEEYAKRFTALKEALEKFRKGYPGDNTSNGLLNPVTNSEFARSASVSEQLQRQEQLIRKLTADLKKEKEESKKKDGALRKYESFYREVKARSAQKAAQRQQQQQRQQANRVQYRGVNR